MLDPQPVLENLPTLLRGAGTTLAVSALAIVFGGALGVALGILRARSIRIVRLLLRGYVDVIRGTPLLVQLYLLYYGLPSLGITFDSFTATVIALSLNSAAYIAEIVRASIRAIPKSQVEAATALGMGTWTTLRRVVLPQSIAIALPSITNEFVDIVKWSSIASIVVLGELTQAVWTIVGRSYTGYVELFLAITIFYFAATSAITFVSRKLEARVARYLPRHAAV